MQLTDSITRDHLAAALSTQTVDILRSVRDALRATGDDIVARVHGDLYAVQAIESRLVALEAQVKAIEARLAKGGL